MEPLKLKGEFKLMDKNFINIGGAFAPGVNTLLVKQLAELHNQNVDEINQIIHDRKKYFKDYKEIVDLKTRPDFLKKLVDNDILDEDYISNENNIYLLSERGYLKLLMALTDDLSWELYEIMLDKILIVTDGFPDDHMPDTIDIQLDEMKLFIELLVGFIY